MVLAGCTRTSGLTPDDAGLSTPDHGGLSAPDDLALASRDFAASQHDLAAVHNNYGSDGPETPVSRVAQAGTQTLEVWEPAAPGKRAVVVLASGLQQPAAAYRPYAKRLASWGIVTLLRDDPGFSQATDAVAADLKFVVEKWIPMQPGMDAGKVAMAGHSRGGQASLLAIEDGAPARAWLGLDPVDAKPPGQANAPQARARMGTLKIPTAFLGAELESQCAPKADNYQVLYAAAPPPSLMLTLLGADHTDFEDAASCSFCFLCNNGSADQATVLNQSVKYVTAFFARELSGDSSVGALLGSGSDATAASK